MWPGIIKYTRILVGTTCGQVSLIKYTRTRQVLELVMWPGIIKYTRIRDGHVARYH